MLLYCKIPHLTIKIFTVIIYFFLSWQIFMDSAIINYNSIIKKMRARLLVTTYDIEALNSALEALKPVISEKRHLFLMQIFNTDVGAMPYIKHGNPKIDVPNADTGRMIDKDLLARIKQINVETLCLDLLSTK